MMAPAFKRPEVYLGARYAGRMTYSIVARDGDGRMGVAVQTCVMGVGAICPWGRAGVGVVATQAFSLAGYGPRLLDRLAAGESPAASAARIAPRRRRGSGPSETTKASRMASGTPGAAIMFAWQLKPSPWTSPANAIVSDPVNAAVTPSAASTATCR